MKSALPQTILSKAEQQAALFRIFGNPQRLLILWLLEEGEHSTTAIAEMLGLDPLNASHHLRILEFHKFIQSRQEKGMKFYQLVDRESLLNCWIFANKPEVLLKEINSSNP